MDFMISQLLTFSTNPSWGGAFAFIGVVWTFYWKILDSMFFISQVTVPANSQTHTCLEQWLSKLDAVKKGRRVVVREEIRHALWRYHHDEVVELNDKYGYHWTFEKMRGRVAILFTIDRSAGFWYNGRYFIVKKHKEGMAVSCLSLSIDPITKLIKEVIDDHYKDGDGKIPVYSLSYIPESPWSELGQFHIRSMETIYLPFKKSIIRDVQSFLENSEWYRERGIPYRRGYLLSGPTGTGKSSLVEALAGYFRLPIYKLCLTGPLANDPFIERFVSKLPSRCILLIEDIDAAGIDRGSEKGGQGSNEERVTLSGLLNIIDGVGACEGRIFITTTNHPELLDAALIRPGRIDVKMEFTNATKSQAKDMFLGIYKNELLPDMLEKLAIEFSRYITDGELSPASIQQFLTARKDAQNAVDEWAALHRLEAAAGDMKEAMELGNAPAVSIGVLRRGDQVFLKSFGHRDVESKKEADCDTSFLIGSVSKLITSAAIAVLVSRGDLSLDDLVSKHLPDFNPIGDSTIGENAKISDICRHLTGLANPINVLLDPSNTNTIKPENIMQFINSLPTSVSSSNGQRYPQQWWYYSSVAFGLLGLIIEAVSGVPFTQFLRENLLKPIGMTQTLLSETEILSNENLAHAYGQSREKQWVKVENQVTSEEHLLALASMGMRSSVKDLLAFCNWTMENQHIIRPMWELYWTRPIDDNFGNTPAYCLGWWRVTIPSLGLGMFTLNEKRKNEDIIGQKSPPRTIYGHFGLAIGSVATVYLSPDSGDAVVVLSNAANGCDVSETVSQITLQALYDLCPKVNPINSLKASREHYDSQILQDEKRLQEENKRNSRYDAKSKLGTYSAFGGTSFIHIKESVDFPSGLAANFNTEQDFELKFSGPNTLHLVLLTTIGWDVYECRTFEFVSSRDTDTGRDVVTGLRWKYNENEDAVVYERKPSQDSSPGAFMEGGQNI